MCMKMLLTGRQDTNKKLFHSFFIQYSPSFNILIHSEICQISMLFYVEF